MRHFFTNFAIIKPKYHYSMKSLYTLILSVFLISGCFSCSTTTSKNELTPEQQDSIAKVKQDSIKLADSIAAIEQHRADSIALAKQKEKEESITKLSKKFRFTEDEFGDRVWVYHTTTPKYTNRNSIHLYFQKDKDGQASNLRFRVQYEAGSWLFIKNMIFNIDGENVHFIPDDMDTDCGYGGRIWEWCDESATYNQDLINKIANAKTVKVKFNGRQYYDTKTMSSKELKAFKETLEFYKALDGK